MHYNLSTLESANADILKAQNADVITESDSHVLHTSDVANTMSGALTTTNNNDNADHNLIKPSMKDGMTQVDEMLT